MKGNSPSGRAAESADGIVLRWRRRLVRRARAIRDGLERRFCAMAWLPALAPACADALYLNAVLIRQRRRHRRRPLPPARAEGAWRVAFVIPWYGRDISGGAEAEVYGLIQALRRHQPDLDIEVLTTTLREFAQDWNRTAHPEGLREEDGVPVRRFHPYRVNRDRFHAINGRCLMPGGTASLWDARHRRGRSPLPRLIEAYILRRLVDSPGLRRYLETHDDDYDAVVLIPYMFATTALGCAVAGPKAMLLPCLHDERYAFMSIYSRAFREAGAVLCHVRAEAALFARLYPDAPSPVLIGEQVQTGIARGDAARFREKYGIRDPFILYAGRQIEGKNLPLLAAYVGAFRKRHPEGAHLRLVLIGKGDLDYTGVEGVDALGFVSPEDKTDAYAAALCLGLLSVNESFSIVLMESWLQETPAIVSADCAVTRDHVEDSGGGYAVASAEAFAAALLALLADPARRADMGARGRAYVLDHFSPEAVTSRFRQALEALTPSGRARARVPPCGGEAA